LTDEYLLYREEASKKKRCTLRWQSCSELFVGLPSTLGSFVQPNAMGSLLLLRGRLLRGLKTGVGSCSKLVLELFNPTSGVNELQLACVKRVANVANVDLQFLASAACGEAIAATAGHFGFEVLWVDAIFHDRDLDKGGIVGYRLIEQ
jgi:hypothetical protein